MGMRRMMLRRTGNVGVNPLIDCAAIFGFKNFGINTGKDKVEVFRVANNDVDVFTAFQIQNTNDVQSFGGASDLKIKTLFDETDNNNHVTQGDENLMPLFYTNGALILENGIISVKFNNDSYLENSIKLNLPTATIISVNKSLSNVSRSRAFGLRSPSSTASETFAQASDNSLRYDGSADFRTIDPDNLQKIRYSERQNSQVYDYLNLDENINKTKSLPNIDGFINVGGPISTLIDKFEGTIQACFFWDSSKINDRLEITDYINNIYNIY